MSYVPAAFNPFALAERVKVNLMLDEEGSPSPIEVMGAIYPGMFGESLTNAPRPQNNDSGQMLDLGVGSYLPTSPIVREALIEGLRCGDLHYRRMPEAGVAIAHKYKEEQGVSIDPERNIFLVAGARVAMSLAMLRFLEPGMKVVIPDPDYVGLALPARGFGGRIVRAPMHRAPDGSLSADVDAMIDAIGLGCGMVILTNPNNPTGHTWSREALQAVADAARRAGARMVINEVYDVLTFDGEQHHSGLGLDDNGHVLVISGPGKTYDITGLGLGWIAGAEAMIRPLADVSFMFHVPIPSLPALLGTRAALSDPVRIEHPRNSVRVLEENAARSRDVFRRIPGALFPRVQAGQFAFPWIGLDDVRFSEIVRHAAGVTLMPGSAWGRMGRGHLRLALANEPVLQQHALARMDGFLNDFLASEYGLDPIPFR
jgi:aspartate/methionine/tyrosine aminotransferase